MTIEEYKQSKLPGYSILSKLDFSPRQVKGILDGEKKKTKSLDLGSLVDTLLTDANEFPNLYYIINKVPSEAYLKLANEYLRLKDLYIEQTGSEEFFDKDSTILTARTNVEFQSNWGNEAVLKNFNEKCSEYLSEVDSAGDKTIISASEFYLASRLVSAVKENYLVNKYFTPLEDIEILYQYPIVFTIEGKEIKALPDIIYIDHKNKTIEVIDIKTYGDSFLSNYYKYRYYYQAAIYSAAVISEFRDKYFGENDYTLLPFKFLAVDTQERELPMLYQISETHLKVASWGGTINNKTVKGFTKLLEDFYWHIENDKWDYNREVYEKGYKLIIE